MPNSWYLKCNASGKRGGRLLVSYSPYLSGGIFNGVFFLLQNLLFSHPPWSSPVILSSARAGRGRSIVFNMVASYLTRILDIWILQRCRLRTTTTASDPASCQQQSTGPFCSTHPATTLISKACFKLNLLAIAFCTVLLCMYRGSSVGTATL